MSIPASDIVTINPSTVGSGGNPLSLNAVVLTNNTIVPTFSVPSFGSADSVSAYFGPASAEYAISQIYFNGFEGKTLTPGTLFFAPYNLADRAAFLRGGSLASITLAVLQTYAGTLDITIDGVLYSSAAINLASATSFSNAATLIDTAFTGGPVVTWNSVLSTFIFTSPTTGASSTITYAVGTGSLEVNLKLTSATGAILSQGDITDTPSSAMDKVKGITQNWASFFTLFEPVTADKTLFADWVQSQNKRYTYIAWDTDGQAIVNGSTTCFGVLVKNANYDGVAVVSGDDADAVAQGKTLAELVLQTAAFIAGSIASINFAQTNGRITQAFKRQSGLLPAVVNKTSADNLLENGYSFYGRYATANDEFVFLYNGQMAGQYKSIDRYVNQIYLNSQIQLAQMTLLTQVTSVPYNESGYSLVRAANLDPLQSAVNFGGIRAGIRLSESQKAQVNLAAGVDISQDLFSFGYYQQVLDPGAIARGLGASPIINIWYTDGGAILKLEIASINII